MLWKFLVIITIFFYASRCEESSKIVIKTRLLKFINVASNDTELVLSSSDKIDASHRKMTVITLSSTKPTIAPILEIYCKTQELENNEYITNQEFCFKRTLDEDESCRQLFTTEKESIYGFTAKISSSSGVLLKSFWEENYKLVTMERKDLSGFYFCRLTNKGGKITSPYFEIRDLNKIRTDFILNTKFPDSHVRPNLASIRAQDLPLVLPCSKKENPIIEPFFFDPNLKSPVKWTLCELTSNNMGVDKCFNEADNSVGLNLKFNFYILFDGTLVITGIKPDQSSARYGMVCISDMIDARAAFVIVGNSVDNLKFKSGFLLDPTKSDTSESKIEINNKPVDVKLDVGNYPDYELVAFYRPKTDAKFKWLKDGVELGNDEGFILSKFSLKFPNYIVPEHKGTYILEADDELKFTFNVEIKEYPTFENDTNIPREIFKIDGEDASVRFSFTPNVKFLHVEINGNPINIESKSAIAQSLNAIKGSTLAQLKASFSPYVSSNNVPAGMSELTYSVKNLLHSQYSAIGQSHYVSVIIGNEYGVSRATTVIKVLPRPHTEHYPVKTSCAGSECVPTKSHRFECSFDLFNYGREGTYVRRFWYFKNETLIEPIDTYIPVPITTLPLQPDNDAPATMLAQNNVSMSPPMAHISEVMSVLRLQGENETLEVSEIEPNSSLRNSLDESLFTCRLLILKPEAVVHDQHGPVELWLANDWVIFDSMSSKFENNALMVAKLQYYKGPPTVTASYYWIIVVLLAIILIVLLIVLLIYLKKRDKKETYNVDAIERNKGKDPINEISAKDEFRTYERDEEDIEAYSKVTEEPHEHNRLLDGKNKNAPAEPKIYYSPGGNLSSNEANI